MAEAKITLTTEAKNEGLEKLNKALAEGQQEVEAMTRELKDLKKATQDGTRATQEQHDAMVKLRQDIKAQKDLNKEYSKEISQTTNEIKKSVKAMADGDKGARGLADSFKLTEGFTTAFSVALGSLAATITTGVVTALGNMASQVLTLGAQMQQSVAQLAAMTGGVNSATEAYRELNDVYRNTNFNEEAVYNMGEQLMRMGYSAGEAAGLIQICADAAAGLGTGQAGAQQLVDALSRMLAVGELTSKQMQQLKMAGVDIDAAFKSLGMNGEQAMKAIEDGTLDSQKAIAALTQYLHQYDGKMAESKNNTIDAWGDVTGNLSTMCAEIGNSIFDAFNQSGIIQTLIDFTQSLIDIIRGDGCGAFSDLRAIADEVLNFIAGLLQFVFDTIKLVIVIINDAYIAFKNFGAQVVDAIRPAVDAVMALYDAVKAVLSSVGAAFHSEVAKSVGATFGGDPDDADSYAILQPNRSTPRSYGGGGGGRSGGGGGGGGSSSKADREAEKAAEKAKKEAEKAAEAAKKAYEDEFKRVFSLLQEDSKTLLDAFLGDPDTAKAKIQAIKDQLARDLEAIDKATAMSENEGSINPLAALLGKTPEELQTEMDARGEVLADFVERTKAEMAKLAEAEASSVDSADKWKSRIKQYAEDVGKSMGDAMADFILGEKTAKEALNDFFKGLIQNAVRMLAQWVGVYLTVLAFGLGPKAAARSANAIALGITEGHAQGGYITGPGTGTSDSIPAMLSNGEYVLRSSAVDRIGVGTLNAMNAGAVPQFADGGSVDDTIAASAGGSSVTLNVSTLDAASFSDFLSRGGLNDVKQALYEDNRRFASTVGVW